LGAWWFGVEVLRGMEALGYWVKRHSGAHTTQYALVLKRMGVKSCFVSVGKPVGMEWGQRRLSYL
jgi:hypothetical protein